MFPLAAPLLNLGSDRFKVLNMRKNSSDLWVNTAMTTHTSTRCSLNEEVEMCASGRCEGGRSEGVLHLYTAGSKPVWE